MTERCPSEVQAGSVQPARIHYSGMQVLRCLQWMDNNFHMGSEGTGTAPLHSSMALVLATSTASPLPV